MTEEQKTTSFTDQKPRIATKQDCNSPWHGKKNGVRFKCNLCGYKFTVGDYWRFVNGKNYFNFIVCSSCDGDDVLDRWIQINKKWEEMKENGPFWYFIVSLENYNVY